MSDRQSQLRMGISGMGPARHSSLGRLMQIYDGLGNPSSSASAKFSMREGTATTSKAYWKSIKATREVCCVVHSLEIPAAMTHSIAHTEHACITGICRSRSQPPQRLFSARSGPSRAARRIDDLQRDRVCSHGGRR